MSEEEGSASDKGSCRHCDRDYKFNLGCELSNLVIRMMARAVKLATVIFAVAFATRDPLDSLDLFWLVSFLVYSGLHELVVLFARDIVSLRHGFVTQREKEQKKAKVSRGCHPRNRCLRVSEWVLCFGIVVTGLCFIAFKATKRAEAPTVTTGMLGQTKANSTLTLPLVNVSEGTLRPSSRVPLYRLP